MNVYAQLSGPNVGATVVAILSTSATLASPIHVQIASESTVEIGATWNGGTSFTNPEPVPFVAQPGNLWDYLNDTERGLFLDKLVTDAVITSERRTAIAAKTVGT